MERISPRLGLGFSVVRNSFRIRFPERIFGFFAVFWFRFRKRGERKTEIERREKIKQLINAKKMRKKNENKRRERERFAFLAGGWGRLEREILLYVGFSRVW